MPNHIKINLRINELPYLSGFYRSNVGAFLFAKPHCLFMISALQRFFKSYVLKCAYLRNKVLYISLFFASTGCAVAPVSLTVEDVASQVVVNEEIASKGIEALEGPLSIEEAVARALMYNLEYRVFRFEQAIASGELELNRFDMVPDVLFRAGYSSGSRVPGQAGNPNDFNSDRSVELSWNILDFVGSHYSAKRSAERISIVNANRRRAMHLLISDVEMAFWQAASAQTLEPIVTETEQELEVALSRARTARTSNVGRPMDNLQHLRQLLVAQQNLIELKEALRGARVQLSNLVNIPYGQNFFIEPIAMELTPSPVVRYDIENLEVIALYNNAEFEMGLYELRIAALEARRSILDLLPGINFNWGSGYKTDTLQTNQMWTQGALVVSSNLIDLFRISRTRDLALTALELQNMRHAALQMSIIAQVHLSRMQVENSLQTLLVKRDIATLDSDIEAFIMQGRDAGIRSDDELVVARVTAAVSLLHYYYALGEYYHAERRLESTLGLEPVFGDLQEVTVDGLTFLVGQARRDWRDGSALERAINNIPSSSVDPNVLETPSADSVGR